jgi:E3 ubiquitin-protein ligase TRIP12
MPILLNVLQNNDQKVLEQGCLCVSRIVESFKFRDNKLEELVSEDLLKAILRLLLPGTTNLINAKIHTSFLRVLAFTARASPKLSITLIKMNVVDTLFQILSGVSPPSGDGELTSKIDKVMIMQSLIHRPRDQIFETLNVICELLPSVSVEGLHYMNGLIDAGFPGPEMLSMIQESHKFKAVDPRIELLDSCKSQLRRFIVVLFPTLTDAYSSTVNLSVRQKVLTAQLKMLSNIDIAILEEALHSVSYPSFLASILSQGDHPSLVSYALQAAEVLLKRLAKVYRYQFYREGVFSEISRLAARPLKTNEPAAQPVRPTEQSASVDGSAQTHSEPMVDPSPSNSIASDVIGDMEMEFHDDHEEDEAHDEHESEGDDDDENEDEDGDENESGDEHEPDHVDYDHENIDTTDSGSQSDHIPVPLHEQLNPEDSITKRAKAFIQLYDSNETDSMRLKAESSLDQLRVLTNDISDFYSKRTRGDGMNLFEKLAGYFGQDPLSSVTSYELLSSKVVGVLHDVFSEKNTRAPDARSAFLRVFMGLGTQKKDNSSTTGSSGTPFSMIVYKLQDLLSRAEHFEVMTAHNNTYDNGRGSSAHMLAKQIRIRLKAEEGSDIAGPLRDTVVTVHALATMKSIGDFLRPRLSMPDRPSRLRREGLPPNIAAYAAALASRGDRGAFFAPAIPTPTDLTNRTLPKRGQAEKTTSNETPPSRRAPSSSTTTSPATTTGLRRSRRHQGQPPVPPSQPPPNKEEDTIECADEKQITDSDSIDEESALNAIVGQLEQEADSDAEEPSAVNLEVAPGGKVTARKEDGTQIATPVSSQTPVPGSRTVSAPRPSSSTLVRQSMTPSRALSYAAAMAATPQDWHLEFSINGQPISPETTLYRVVHFSRLPGEQNASARNLLSNTHTITYKKVPGPPPAESSTLTQALDNARPMQAGIPTSLSDNPTTGSILQLLSILHGLNSNIDDVLAEYKDGGKLVPEPLSQFVNTKLTAKLNRQLEEPLIVASGCLPSWSEDLPRHYPFLFPFETRHLFLQSTSFGFARSMNRWQNDQSNDSRMRDERQFLGRLQRQKVRISRAKILESALKVMDLYGGSAAILEVEFFDEVGTGLGPTLEFYSSVSKEFAKKRLKLWRENESDPDSEYAFGTRGLFPAPMSEETANSENGKKLLSLFKALGKFVARSMLDSRIIDIAFNPVLFRIGTSTSSGAVTPSLGAVETVDENLARSLRPLKKAAFLKRNIEEDDSLTPEQKAAEFQKITVHDAKIEDLSLDFTLPGYPDILLKPDGSNVPVTIENIGQYVEKVLDLTLGSGVRRQVEAFQAGFSLVFPYAAIQAFTPDELVMLFGRVEEDWSLETLMDSIKADHGYNLDSKSVRNLLQIMSSLSAQDRREFLQFVTGSPKLPIGGKFSAFLPVKPKLIHSSGFKALTPMFTVVCKPSEAPFTSDDYLPSVMTCVNYLKLPDYSTIEIMRKKLEVATKEGQGAFHLS